MRFTSVLSVVQNEIRTELKGKGAWTSVVLFVLAANLSAYLSFKSIPESYLWNGVFWIIILFGCLNSASQIFKETSAQFTFLYQLISPQELLLGKVIFSSLLNLFIITISSFTYLLFFNSFIANDFLFVLIVILGALNISVLLSVSASIAFKSDGGNTLLNVISIPILIPILVILISASNDTLKNVEFHTFLDCEIHVNESKNIKAKLLKQYGDDWDLRDEDGKIRRVDMANCGVDLQEGKQIIVRAQYELQSNAYIMESCTEYKISQSNSWIKIAILISIIALLLAIGFWVFPKYWNLN